jgi:hypothetical protein
VCCLSAVVRTDLTNPPLSCGEGQRHQKSASRSSGGHPGRVDVLSRKIARTDLPLVVPAPHGRTGGPSELMFRHRRPDGKWRKFVSVISRTSILTSRAKPIAGDRERACGLLLGARLPPPTIGATEGLTQRNVRVRAVMTYTEMQLEKCRFILPINGAGVHAAISSKPSLCPLVATLGAKTV